MTQIVFPMAGTAGFFNDTTYKYPKPLIEIANKTMIEWCLENYSSFGHDSKFVFVVNEEDCARFHLDDTIRLLSETAEIVIVRHPTQGAACSVLLTVDLLVPEDELIVANFDQYFELDLQKVVGEFRMRQLDAGVITFSSVHPKWSYIRCDKNENIVETAEKRPLSRRAIAGFYYFRSASLFFEGAMSMIRKDARVENMFFVAPVLNEMILQKKALGFFELGSEERYHSFYSPQKIQEFEKGNSNEG